MLVEWPHPRRDPLENRWSHAAGLFSASQPAHDLRHVFPSGLMASGSDVVAVQRAPGHAKSTTTLTRYAHRWPSAKDRVCDASARLVAEVFNAGEGTVRPTTPQ